MTYATINPYTGDTVATFPDATDEEVKTALDKADAAFLSWRETSFAEARTSSSHSRNLAWSTLPSSCIPGVRFAWVRSE